jgi:hypothetical protein
VKLALDVLQEVAGPCSPVLFLKMGIENWTPVGEENLIAMVKGKDATEAVVICDSEGNSKAMSGWVSQAVAEKYSESLRSKGLLMFDGELKLPI